MCSCVLGSVKKGKPPTTTFKPYISMSAESGYGVLCCLFLWTTRGFLRFSFGIVYTIPKLKCKKPLVVVVGFPFFTLPRTQEHIEFSKHTKTNPTLTQPTWIHRVRVVVLAVLGKALSFLHVCKNVTKKKDSSILRTKHSQTLT